MQAMAQKHFDKIMAVLRAMPRSMLLMIRNLNTIRAINRTHGHPVDRYAIMARSAISGVFKEENHVGWIGRVKSWWQLLIYEYRIRSEGWLLKIGMLYIRILQFFG